jgi:hypothetical protein
MKNMYNVLEGMPYFILTMFKFCGQNKKNQGDQGGRIQLTYIKKKESTNQCEWQRKETKGGYQEGIFFFSKSNEKKKNGVKWKDLEVDTLIVIQGEINAKFSNSAKKQGRILLFL